MLDDDKYLLWARRMKKVLMSKKDGTIVSGNELLKGGLIEEARVAFLYLSKRTVLRSTLEVNDHCTGSKSDTKDPDELYKVQQGSHKIS